ncbi:MAG TPA: zf-TFIIB domain-containing protein [Haliangiales bacterium]|nr:zf-TFIIB domain-containing protein [Haliangiales bacterium]
MPFKKTAKGAGAGKARVEKKPVKAKPAAAAKVPKAAKARPPAKPSKPPRRVAAARPSATAAELVELRHRLALAEEAASRVGALEAQVAELERELGTAHADRQSALDRLAALEERLAESAESPAPASSTAEIEQRLANALAEKANATRRIRDLERDLESVKAALARERAAHAGAAAEPSGASHAEKQLQHRVGELEGALATREAELTRLLERRPGMLTCPRCGGKMVEFMHLGVTLDRCTECSGLFFDSGELQEVIRREYPEAEETREPEPEVTVERETVVAVVMPVAAEADAPRRKGFFRSLFGRKE